MNDLKFAIESNNKKRVQEIVEHNRKKLSIHQFSTQQLSELEQDELGAALMPFDIPIVEHEAFPVKTLGNGNCLFNSVSFLLSGSYALANILRMMTAAEIYINADKYSNHPKFLMAADCPEITYDSSNLFSIVLRDEASVISDPVKAIEKEAWMTCTDRQWSGMVDVMGLASVIGNNIWSVYPDCNNNIRPIISGVVKPLITSNNQNTIFIMWSRDGNLDNTHGRPFEPNHFIPIVYKPANPYELHQQRDDQLLPPTKKMKVNSEYDGENVEIEAEDAQMETANAHIENVFHRIDDETHAAPNIEQKYKVDLGRILNCSMTPKECLNAIQRLSDAEKYHLLTNHIKLTPGQIFPSTFIHGCYRSFKPKMIEGYTWAIYSPCLDGVFCLHCSLFCRNRENKSNFVNKPFTQWHKIKEKLNEHTNSKYHMECAIDSANFVLKHEQPERTLPFIVNDEKRVRCKENRHILKMIAKTILFCGRQNIALRGDIENIKDSSKNPGNFLALLKVLSESDALLKKHLEHPTAKNSTYLSPSIQNELISIIGSMIKQNIIDEIQKAKYYAIMADEVESHNKEILPLCIRFLDENQNIREEFLEFIMLERITGEHIAGKILAGLEAMNIQVRNMRGQSYDGAPNMSSESIGVQKIIRKHAPLATYTHCCSHVLNLVIVHSCKLPSIRNVIDKMKAVCLFFNNSPKREGLLKAIILRDIPDTNKRKPLLNLCATRWAVRHESYKHFYQAYIYMVKAFEVIAYGMHEDLNQMELFKDWNNDSKKDASGLLQSITSFDFIINFLILYMTLARLDEITKSLQEKELDILGAIQKISKVQEDYVTMRENFNPLFQNWFDQAVRMAEKVGETPTLPRIAKRQEHRSNTPVENCEICEKQPCHHQVLQYYQRNVAVPFVDHIKMELKERFSEFSVKSSLLIGLVPSVIKTKVDSNLDEAIEMYGDDLPSVETFGTELILWKQKCVETKNTPSTLIDALKICDKDRFPNIYVLLQIACTLPITSCSCERGASSLKRLRTYMRASMTENRLTGLALMHIHYAKLVVLDKVVDVFAKKHPRKMELQNIIFDY